MYCHLQKQSLQVKLGDKVKVGQVLGIMGSTGKSTGKHLHYEVRTQTAPSYGFGHHTNPMGYLIKQSQESWKYWNALGNETLKKYNHDVAEFIRDNFL
jgi:murein DD-endopeptidase MepM/ murein hydrolase activator NlpD